MTLNNEGLARKIEEIKIQGTMEYIINRKKLSPTYNGDYLSLDGRGTVFQMDNYCFGVGFGLNGDVLSSDIERVENFIRKKENCSNIHLELTPFSDQTLLKILQESGYTLEQFLAVWVLKLEDWNPNKGNLRNDEVSIVKVGAEESYEWARTVALGFSSDQNTTEDSIESVRGFLNLSHSAAFLLKEKEESVAGGFVAISDQLGEMFLTSTIQTHRGRGYQNLLIEERIKYALSKGCTHLTVTTKPNNTSARNMVRNGFKLAYNKAIMKSSLFK